jgi:predicted transcriptional regulator
MGRSVSASFDLVGVSEMKRRCRMDIYADILAEAKEGATQTRIMYHANVSFFLLKHYLRELMSLRLIGVQKRLYKTTERGLYFLELYGKIGLLVRKIEVISA